MSVAPMANLENYGPSVRGAVREGMRVTAERQPAQFQVQETAAAQICSATVAGPP